MSEYVTALMEYLKQTNPDDWHKIASGWNWDNGHEPLAWITRQPHCDRGTALLIYWRGGAGWFVQFSNREEVPNWTLEEYDLIKEIENRYVSGFYTRHEIAFDPRNNIGYDWTSDYADLPIKQPIPGQLYEATSGKEIADTYPEEGFPQAVIDAVGE